jgi:hypothetical protein
MCFLHMVVATYCYDCLSVMSIFFLFYYYYYYYYIYIFFFFFFLAKNFYVLISVRSEAVIAVYLS